MRASMVISSIPTRDTRTKASITRPLSRIVSITSTSAVPDDRWTAPDPSYGETVMRPHSRSTSGLQVTQAHPREHLTVRAASAVVPGPATPLPRRPRDAAAPDAADAPHPQADAAAPDAADAPHPQADA